MEPGQKPPPGPLLRLPLRNEASVPAQDGSLFLPRVSGGRRRGAPPRALRCQLPRAAPSLPRPAGRSAQTRLFISAGAQGEAEAETMPGKLKVKIVAGRHLPVMDRASDLTDAFVEVGARSCPSKHRERRAL